jgi:flagellar hook-associated protein 2
MSLSTNLISGLSSGFDWRSMIDQLIAVEHRRVDLVENRKSEYESKLTEWQSVNTKLLSLKTAAEGLKDAEDFHLYLPNMTTNRKLCSKNIFHCSSTEIIFRFFYQH